MNANKKKGGWILCPSKTFPGEFYYFNVRNGETAWSLGDAEKKIMQKHGGIPKVMENHNHPEPRSPPIENPNKIDSVFIKQPRLSLMHRPTPVFGQSVFPKALPSKTEEPNVIWTPFQIQVPFVLAPKSGIQPNEVAQTCGPNEKTSQVTLGTPKLMCSKEMFIQACENTNFVNYNKSAISFDKNNKVEDKQQLNWITTSTPVKKITATSSMATFKTLDSYEPFQSKTNLSFSDINPKITSQKQMTKEPVFNIKIPSKSPEKIVTHENKWRRVEPNTGCNKADFAIANSGHKTLNSSGDDLRMLLLSKKRKNLDFGANTSEMECKKIKTTRQESTPQPKKRVSFNLEKVIINNTSNIYEYQDESTNFNEKYAATMQLLKDLAGPKSSTDLWYIVVDTQILLEEFSFLVSFVQIDSKCRLVVPSSVFAEVSAMSRGECRGRSSVTLARNVIRRLTNAQIIVQSVNEEGTESPPNDAILKCCFKAMDQNIHLILITKDQELLITARSYPIHCYDIKDIKNGLELKPNSFEFSPLKITIQNDTESKFTKNGFAVHSLKRKLFDVDDTEDLNEKEKEIIRNFKRIANINMAKDIPRISIENSWISNENSRNSFENFQNSNENSINSNDNSIIMNDKTNPVLYNKNSIITNENLNMGNSKAIYTEWREANSVISESPIDAAMQNLNLKEMPIQHTHKTTRKNETTINAQKNTNETVSFFFQIPQDKFDFSEITNIPKNGPPKGSSYFENRQEKVTSSFVENSEIDKENLVFEMAKQAQPVFETNKIKKPQTNSIFEMGRQQSMLAASMFEIDVFKKTQSTNKIDIENPVFEMAKQSQPVFETNEIKEPQTNSIFEMGREKSNMAGHSMLGIDVFKKPQRTNKVDEENPVFEMVKQLQPIFETNKIEPQTNSFFEMGRQKSNMDASMFETDFKKPQSMQPVIKRIEKNNSTIDLNSYYVKSKVMENRLRERMEEWVCSFKQIMEESLSGVLEKLSSSVLKRMTPPWSLFEALQCTKTVYREHTVIKDIVDELCGFLYEPNCRYDKLKKNICPNDIMKSFGCGLHLIKYLKNILQHSDELLEAEEYLLNMLNDIKKPTVDIEEPLVQTPVFSKYEDNEPRQNFIKNPSEIINYLKNHYPEWQTYDEIEKIQPKIDRTFGKDLSQIKLNKKGLTVSKERENEFNEPKKGEKINDANVGHCATRNVADVAKKSVGNIPTTELLERTNRISTNFGNTATKHFGNSTDYVGNTLTPELLERTNIISTNFGNTATKHFGNSTDYVGNTLTPELLERANRISTNFGNTATKHFGNSTDYVGNTLTPELLERANRIPANFDNTATNSFFNSTDYVGPRPELLERTKRIPISFGNTATINVCNTTKCTKYEPTNKKLKCDFQNAKILIENDQNSIQKITKTKAIDNKCIDSKEFEKCDNTKSKPKIKSIFDNIKPKDSTQKHNLDKFKIDGKILAVKISVPNDYKKRLQNDVEFSDSVLTALNKKLQSIKGTKEIEMCRKLVPKCVSNMKPTETQKDLEKFETTGRMSLNDPKIIEKGSEIEPKIIRNLNFIDEFEKRMKNKEILDLKEPNYSSITNGPCHYTINDDDKTHTNSVDSHKICDDDDKTHTNGVDSHKICEINNLSQNALNHHSDNAKNYHLDNAINHHSENDMNDHSENDIKDVNQNYKTNDENNDFNNDTGALSDKNDVANDSGFENESLYSLMKSFSSELGGSLEYIQGLIEGSIQEFREGKISEDTKKMFRLNTFEANFSINKIIKVLNKFVKKESHTLKQNGGSGPKHIFKNTEAVVKCLEQALMLHKVLNGILSVNNTDDNKGSN